MGAQPVPFLVFLRNIAEDQYSADDFPLRITNRRCTVRNVPGCSVTGNQIGMVGQLDDFSRRKRFGQRGLHFAAVKIADDIEYFIEFFAFCFLDRIAGHLDCDRIQEGDPFFAVGCNDAVADGFQGQTELLRNAGGRPVRLMQFRLVA